MATFRGRLGRLEKTLGRRRAVTLEDVLFALDHRDDPTAGARLREIERLDASALGPALARLADNAARLKGE